MKELQSREERSAVLKHEALHIMLKHIIQMRDPQFPNKRLYNIAADLEVNQYIGYPWKLPDSAIVLGTFPDLDLPADQTAKIYYDLLQKEREQNPNSKSSQQINNMCNGDGHNGGGHSDHRGWEDDFDLGSGEGSQSKGNLNGGINFPSASELTTHEMDIERQMQQAKDSLSGRQAGSVPGRFVRLLNDWMKARQPSVDWKRELRLFVSSNPSTSSKKSVRKKNKRYARWVRQSLLVERVSADVINIIAHSAADALPKITWSMLPTELANDICIRRTVLNANRQTPEAIIPWARIPLYNILQIQQLFKHLDWPTWEDVSDQQLRRLNLLRTPLDPDQLPVDFYIILAKEKPSLMPSITWQDIGKTKTKEFKKRYPHLSTLEKPIWGLLPSDMIVWLVRGFPHLFSLSWQDVPPQLVYRLPFYQLEGDQPFRIDRFLKRSLPGLKKERNLPKILIIIDTSGSVSKQDIEYLFSEIDAIHKLGAEVHVLQADTKPVLYYQYEGEKPIAGRGGTAFEPAIQWLNQARETVLQFL